MDKPIVMRDEPITRVLAYLSKKYPRCKATIQSSKQMSRFEAFKQSDWGKAGDCTITSIASIFYNYLGKSKPFGEIYNIVESKGYEWGYGDFGTHIYSMRTIMNKVAKELGLPQRTTVKYGKGVLWNFETIKKNLAGGKYTMLSFKDDGRDYYGAHSVTVVGYAQYNVKLETGETKVEKFIAIKDNWSKDTRWLDYEMIDFVSAVHTY